MKKTTLRHWEGQLEIVTSGHITKRLFAEFTDVAVKDVTHIHILSESFWLRLEAGFFSAFSNLRHVSVSLEGSGWVDEFCSSDNLYDTWLFSGSVEPDIQIASWAFSGCRNLESVIINSSVSLSASGELCCFPGVNNPCLVLTECPDAEPFVMVEAILARTEVEADAFSDCPRLREVSIRNARTISLDDAAFRNCPALTVVDLHQRDEDFIPEAELERFGQPAHLRFPGCDGLADGEGLGWDAQEQHLLFYRPPVPEGKLTVSGRIKTVERKQFSCREDIREVVLGDGVKCIAEEAFSYCPELTRVVIPETVTAIAPNAFEGCEKLREVLRPGGAPATEVVIGRVYIKNTHCGKK